MNEPSVWRADEAEQAERGGAVAGWHQGRIEIVNSRRCLRQSSDFLRASRTWPRARASLIRATPSFGHHQQPATSTRTSTAATRPRRRKLFLLIELCYAVYVCAARWCRYCRQCNIASDSKEEETATTITTFVRLIVVLRVPLVYSK